MTSSSALISEAVRGATSPGDVAEPTSLLASIVGLDNPITTLSDRAEGNKLFEAFYDEFGFIRTAQSTKAPPDPINQARLTCLLRWLINEFRQWRQTEDPRNGKLVALLIVAHACDRDNGLWKMLPADFGSNADLTGRLKDLISSFTVEFTSRGGASEPIWEREAVEQLRLAEVQGDWANIGDRWRPFDQIVFPNALQIQVVRCLYRCGIDHLVHALTNLRQTAVAMQVTSTLDVDQRLLLGIASDNPYIQFSCVYQTFSGRQTPQQLLSDEQQLLTSLLLRVANDTPRWSGWMRVFNTYPLRYPALQGALGQALAAAPDAAIEAYINSINLHPKQAGPNAGRQCVAACLREFRVSAAAARQTALWMLAHERWLEWRFNRADPDQHLFKINWSELDYAVVGYACECLDDAGRNRAMDFIRGELQELDDSWHASVSDITTTWNRLLSQFEPYAHAGRAMKTGDDWLTENREYWPFDQSKEEYVMMKFGVSR